jgi:hypothetical protein
MEEANTKNLYVKSWFLCNEAIEARLAETPLIWKRIGSQFFFMVTAETYEDVRAAIAVVTRDNGSVIRESEIDYVTGTPQVRQLTDSYGIENVIVSRISSEEA